MPLDPQAQKLLDLSRAVGSLPLNAFSVDDARRIMAAGLASVAPIEIVGKVHDDTIPTQETEIPIRVYTPFGDGPFPILIYFHGGGWVLNSIETHDRVCRYICNKARVIVVSVGYRLAPENKFPAAVDDAYAATSWVSKNAHILGGLPTRLAVGGDSSGATLATVCALMAVDRGGPPIRYQLLFYPVTDHYSRGTSSYEEMANGYILTKELMMWYWDHYLNVGEDINNPYICPLRMSDMSGLPPTLIVTAEYDILRDEGELYAKMLQEAGVPTVFKLYEGMMHGFILRLDQLDAAKAALDFGCENLSMALNN